MKKVENISILNFFMKFKYVGIKLYIYIQYNGT